MLETNSTLRADVYSSHCLALSSQFLVIIMIVVVVVFIIVTISIIIIIQ